jgi:hypothetical protein
VPNPWGVGPGKRWQLTHFSDKALRVAKKSQKKATGPRGRPTKKTDSLVATLLRLISEGGPYDLCCQAVGITRETFYSWRRDDPAFATRVEQVAAKGSLGRLKKIEEHGQNDWHAFGWMLERRHPEHFARAETQLNVVAQAAVVNGNGGARNIELIVVEDLAFLGLKQHPAYTHRPGVREAEQVPPELDGILERANQNIIVSSESRARASTERHAKIRARTRELLDAREANTGNAQGSAQSATAVGPESVSVQVSPATTEGAPVQEPLPDKPASWWRPFIFGGALIPKADAALALRKILSELSIPVPADEQALEFATPNVVQPIFCQALERVSGSDVGWRAMVQIYERAQARERLRSDH